MKKLAFLFLFFLQFFSLQAQDYNFSSEYNKLLWPIRLGVGGGLTGDDDNYKRLTLFHGHSIALQTGSNLPNHGLTRLYINSSGNVGIGTSAPTTRLTISSVSSDTDVQTNIYNPSVTPGSVAGIRFHTGSGWSVMLRTNQERAWLELTDSEGIWQHRWVAKNYYTMGDIGVGTTDTRGYKLAVAGSVISESVTVKLQSSWPDFVFAPSYRLLPLSEVESHIKQHGHLPKVPSAEEVQANGIDLGKTDALLLQKIEELTLYVIEQEKRIKQLEQEKMSRYR